MNPIQELGAIQMKYAEERAYAGQLARGLDVAPPTYTERVLSACADAEKRAADLKRVKEILDKYPEIEELLTILGRVHV